MSRAARSTSVAILLLASLLLAGCIGTASLEGLLGRGNSPAPTAVPRAEGSEETWPDGRPLGGTLRLSGGLPPTLDPAMAQDSTSAEYIVHLFSGLVRLDAELEVVGDLAEGWEVSADGRTYTFRLREDARFADGRPITSADVVYSLERACSPALGSPVAASYLNDIIGVAAYARGEAEGISGLRAPSAEVVEIAIDAPKAYFAAKLTYPAAFVVDREQIEAQGDRWMVQPNGSGPFVLSEVSRERIVLERNARYYGLPPALDRVEYVITGGFPITMYENDELDIVEVPPSEMERMSDPENPLHDELEMASELSVLYLGVNVNLPPYDDPDVRRALARAIDKAKIADLVLQGSATPADGILPPSMPDYDPSLAGLPYDPDAARALLAGSDYGAEGLPPLVLVTSGTSGYPDAVTEAVLSFFEDNLGVEATIHQVEWGDFLRDMNAQRYPLYLTGWIADYPDSENFLDLLFHSASSQNHMGYANARVDGLLEAARVEQDPEERTRLYREAERIIVEESPWIPLTHGVRISLVKPYVQGFGSTSAIFPWLAQVYVER
ncbi:MAG: peptide ABC transporter substrate-binding protein [Chloroflexi bacterium]|nr:peptide ABC transporter substrate-binding protein [Chloroflexota bacterium]